MPGTALIHFLKFIFDSFYRASKNAYCESPVWETILLYPIKLIILC